ncbi:hypothetical protein AMECASPLE_010247 [Ameca splendens]|uniref:Uncharacterized protein n=1 Tax=Ameca splendens TaxID=208324 RepID=A0ABV0ZWC7_9TELE
MISFHKGPRSTAFSLLPRSLSLRFDECSQFSPMSWKRRWRDGGENEREAGIRRGLLLPTLIHHFLLLFTQPTLTLWRLNRLSARESSVFVFHVVNGNGVIN